MRGKRAAAILLTVAFCLQAAVPAFAGVIVAGTGAVVSGPGEGAVPGPGGGPGVVQEPWVKRNGQYYDSEGNVIDGVVARGVSVSKWQGAIDWNQAAADDVSFAMIRMVSYGYEGEITVDETFDANMRGAAAAGIRTAPYVFLQTRTVDEARAAAQYAVDTARNYAVNYPIAVDIESQYILDLSTQELTDIVNAFCEVIAASGYTPIVYSDYWKFTNEMDTSQIPYDIWLARYGVTDSSYPNRTIWQPTQTGRVNGIGTDVCLEFAFKQY